MCVGLGFLVGDFLVEWFGFFFWIVITSTYDPFAVMFLLSLSGLNTSENENWTKLINFLEFVLKILHDIIKQAQVNCSLLQDFQGLLSLYSENNLRIDMEVNLLIMELFW